MFLKKKANLTFFIIFWNACLQGQGEDGSAAVVLRYYGSLSLDTQNPQTAIVIACICDCSIPKERWGAEQVNHGGYDWLA